MPCTIRQHRYEIFAPGRVTGRPVMDLPSQSTGRKRTGKCILGLRFPLDGMSCVPTWHTCGTLAEPLNGSAGPPFPHRIPSTSPPCGAWGYGGDTVALSVCHVGTVRGVRDARKPVGMAQSWHSPGESDFARRVGGWGSLTANHCPAQALLIRPTIWACLFR